MSSFTNNLTLSLLGEECKAKIHAAVQRLDSPEAKMLAERLAAGESGEVEDLLAVAVLAQAVADLSDRLARLEALEEALESNKSAGGRRMRQD